MNVDYILETLNRHDVACLLIGGMNFLLRHAPILTYDVDLWIEDTARNLDRCVRAPAELDAQWGASESDWRPVAERTPDWIRTQQVFCLTSPHGAIDVFRSVKGLDDWSSCRRRACAGRTAAGGAFWELSDEDMLRCQMALPRNSATGSAFGHCSKRSGNRSMADPCESDPKWREEAKREACWDPAVRWRVIQETITWAEAQATVRRNTPPRCLELQRAKLARFRQH